MKKLIIALILTIITVTAVCTEQMMDFILAKVGREVILFSDLAKQISQIRSARMWHDDMTYEAVLEDMIESKLIIMKAREMSIRIDERRVRNQAEAQLNAVRNQFATAGEFFRELRNAGLTQTDLRNYYEELITEQFLRDRLIQQEIRNKINITDSELFEYYHSNIENIPQRDESYELAMILRTTKPSEHTQRLARDKINNIAERLKRGEDFARLARSQSDCPSASQGGDLGYFTRGMMVPEFDEVAFNIAINEISEVVRTQFGFHIIMVTDKRENEVRASHILAMIKETEEDIDAERTLTQEIAQRIKDGESFAELAAEFSEDEDTKANRGIIGILTKEEFPQWFINDLNNLQVGEITPVLEHENMFYIFTIYRDLPKRTQDFDEVKEQLRQMLTQQRQIELYHTWMENLKKEIYVHIYIDRLEELY